MLQAVTHPNAAQDAVPDHQQAHKIGSGATIETVTEPATAEPTGQRIAIIGSGIAGLTCGYLLHKQHQISLFEANNYIGGHTHTVDVAVQGKSYAIDTGFIVFNDWTYPNFIKLMQQLAVPSQATEMSFSVRQLQTGLEYNGHSLNSLFAQRRNLLRPRFYKFVYEIIRFNRLCKKTLLQPLDSQITLAEFLARHGFSEYFSYHYILPMCAAIWSASLQDSKTFPLGFFLRFFENHGLLNIVNRPQWYTLVGGSRSYIKPLTAGFADKIQLNCKVDKVQRHADTVAISFADGTVQYFDQVIFACHSDQALQLLADPSVAEQQILGQLPYTANEVVLHTDTRLLPRRKLAWASWNYRLGDTQNEWQQPAAVTYNMNILQLLPPAAPTFCVTLNHSQAIDPCQVLRRFEYHHPVFNQATLQAQQQRLAICGQQRSHFCGAYWYNGFHEDGVRSALDVCQRFGQSL